MALAKLAFKNLTRNRRRTALTTISVVAGVGMFILGQGFVDGVEENVITSAIDGTVGHVMARPAGYPIEGNQRPLDVLLQISPAARQLLDSGTVAWTARTLFAPLAASRSDNLRVNAIGYDPERDPLVFPRTLWRITGAMPNPSANEVGVSPTVARLLGLSVGDRLVLQVRTHHGAINAMETRVSAIIATKNAALDGLGLWVPKALTEQLIVADQPTHISVKLDRREAAAAFAPRLREALGAQSEVVTWEEEVAELLRLQQIRRKSLNIVVFIVLALAAFGIANTILMAAHERVREIGTLRSLGMTESDVLRLFLLEGGFMGLLGGILGSLWAGGLISYWSRHPIDFSATMSRSGNVSFSAYVYTRLDPSMIALAIGIGVATSIIASIYPARVAARMVPADAVRAA